MVRTNRGSGTTYVSPLALSIKFTELVTRNLTGMVCSTSPFSEFESSASKHGECFIEGVICVVNIVEVCLITHSSLSKWQLVHSTSIISCITCNFRYRTQLRLYLMSLSFWDEFPQYILKSVKLRYSKNSAIHIYARQTNRKRVKMSIISCYNLGFENNKSVCHDQSGHCVEVSKVTRTLFPELNVS